MFQHKFKLLPFAALLMLGACDSKGPKTSPNGLEYEFFTENKLDKKAEAGDVITLHFVIKDHKDSLLQDSHKASKMDSMLGRTAQPQVIELQKSSFKGGLEDGLMMMSEGDSALFKVPIDSLYKGAPAVPPGLKAGTKMSFYVKMVKIQKSAEQRKIEETKIDSVLKVEQKPNLIDTASKMRYIISAAGTGKKPNPGDVISVHHKVTLLGDTSTVVNSFGSRALQFPMGNAKEQGGLPAYYDKAVALLNYGGEGTFYVPSSLAFGSKGIQGLVPPNAILVAKIALLSQEEAVAAAAKLEQAQKDAADKQLKMDEAAINSYIKKEKLSGVKSTASGLRYIVTKAGNGTKATAGDRVTVNYKGMLTNGKVFDSSEGKPEAFSFNLGRSEVIKGWDEGIELLTVGSKAKLIIPSTLGYGAQGAGGDIPPNAVLVFEVELLKTEKAK